MDLHPITPDNYAAALTLSVRADQSHLVATISKSLADAFVYEGSIFRLAYVGDIPVGFLLLYPYSKGHRNFVNIVRLMIDEHHQSKGYGRALLAEALKAIRALQPPAHTARVSTLPENRSALQLYKSAGFIESGMEHGEISLYLELRS